jgi:tRNA (adenine22-N1)-methyltransferase
MNKRLETIYSMIESGRGLIDVGTDHGFLPAALAAGGYSGKLFASDINAMPLSRARETAHACGAEDRIVFLLSDGLDACPKDEIDTIVMAGMGGELICRILDRAEWCLEHSYTLILQPMTKIEVLRYGRANNGLQPTEERFVEDGGILYQIKKARYAENMSLKDAELFTGSFRNLRNDPLSSTLIRSLIRRFENEFRGRRAAEHSREGRLAILTEILAQLEEMEKNLP